MIGINDSGFTEWLRQQPNARMPNTVMLRDSDILLEWKGHCKALRLRWDQEPKEFSLWELDPPHQTKVDSIISLDSALWRLIDWVDCS